MNTITLEEKYILEYIKDMLNDFKVSATVIKDAKYHHNAYYKDASSICRYGILSLMDLKKSGIKNYTDEILKKMQDTESHINGTNGVSLSIVGLQDLYHNEDEYDPFTPTYVDFLLSSEITAYRFTEHYGNAFITFKSIELDRIKTVDIRLLKLIEMIENKNNTNNCYTIQSLIKKYNYLKDIALALKDTKLDIPLREMSNNDNSSLDLDKLTSISKLILK